MEQRRGRRQAGSQVGRDRRVEHRVELMPVGQGRIDFHLEQGAETEGRTFISRRKLGEEEKEEEERRKRRWKKKKMEEKEDGRK